MHEAPGSPGGCSVPPEVEVEEEEELASKGLTPSMLGVKAEVV